MGDGDGGARLAWQRGGHTYLNAKGLRRVGGGGGECGEGMGL